MRRTVAQGLTHDGVAAIVFVSDPEGEWRPSTQVLQVLYGLTTAEAAVATQLATDLTVEEIALACGYTRQTVQ